MACPARIDSGTVALRQDEAKIILLYYILLELGVMPPQDAFPLLELFRKCSWVKTARGFRRWEITSQHTKQTRVPHFLFLPFPSCLSKSSAVCLPHASSTNSHPAYASCCRYEPSSCAIHPKGTKLIFSPGG